MSSLQSLKTFASSNSLLSDLIVLTLSVAICVVLLQLNRISRFVLCGSDATLPLGFGVTSSLFPETGHT